VEELDGRHCESPGAWNHMLGVNLNHNIHFLEDDAFDPLEDMLLRLHTTSAQELSSLQTDFENWFGDGNGEEYMRLFSRLNLLASEENTGSEYARVYCALQDIGSDMSRVHCLRLQLTNPNLGLHLPRLIKSRFAKGTPFLIKMTLRETEDEFTTLVFIRYCDKRVEFIQIGPGGQLHVLSSKAIQKLFLHTNVMWNMKCISPHSYAIGPFVTSIACPESAIVDRALYELEKSQNAKLSRFYTELPNVPTIRGKSHSNHWILATNFEDGDIPRQLGVGMADEVFRVSENLIVIKHFTGRHLKWVTWLEHLPHFVGSIAALASHQPSLFLGVKFDMTKHRKAAMLNHMAEGGDFGIGVRAFDFWQEAEFPLGLAQPEPEPWRDSTIEEFTFGMIEANPKILTSAEMDRDLWKDAKSESAFKLSSLEWFDGRGGIYTIGEHFESIKNKLFFKVQEESSEVEDKPEAAQPLDDLAQAEEEAVDNSEREITESKAKHGLWSNIKKWFKRH